MRCVKSWLVGLVGIFAFPVYGGDLATASDTLELPAGGLVFVPHEQVAVEAEEIVLARDSVRTTYAVRNRGTDPITLALAWPLPEIDMNAIGDDVAVLADGDPINFSGVTVVLDGMPVSLGFEQRASAFHRDITAILEQSGVILNPMAGVVAAQLAKLPAAVLAELEVRGAIRREDERVLPNWATKTTAFWSQTFEPAKLMTFGLTYVPVTASGLWQAEQLAELRETYCIDAALEAAIAARAGGSGRGLFTHQLTYTMANNPGWWAPTANFRLVIEKTSSQTLVATCVKGLKPIGPTLLEWVTRDFRPKDDVRVLFIN